MADEPDGSRVGPLGGGFDLRLTELEGAAGSVSKLTTSLKGLQDTLRGFGSATGNALNNMLKDIRKTADDATRSVQTLSSAGGGPTPPPGGGGAGGGGGPPGSWLSNATAQASASTRLTGGIATASTYLTGFSNPLVGVGMGGLRFLRDRIGTNRNTAIESGAQLSMASRQQGASISDMMGQLGQFPGGIYGTPQDLLGLYGAAPQFGASFGFGAGGQGAGRQGPRAAGMLAGIRQAQAMNPGASVTQIAGEIGGFAANTGAQQGAQMMTGGAYGMIAAGGRQKSLSEWAEDILKWLMNLRGGSNRGKPFTYGQLMAQYFPGSNIDAWFTANGVPQSMRQYWWTYALEKADKSPDRTTGGAAMNITPDDTNVAWQRLRASSELTRTEFNLGSQMTGAYLNKEQANRWFNQMFGQAQQKMIPALAGSKAFSWIQFLPDTIEDMLMSGVEGIAQAKWGPQGTGDVGDIGDNYGSYTTTGGTGMAGLSPNMRSKLGPMMRANKRLKVTSGLRDNAMQKRLKDRGYSRVSGKPSAHTRGDAADLGPPSEYGWIMRNANKFGLNSGKSQGEPWHVGIGDFDFGSVLGGAMDPLGLLSGIMGQFGIDSDDPSAFAQGMAKIMSFFLGGLTDVVSGVTGGDAPKYDPELFNKMVSASTGSIFGGLPSIARTSLGGGAAGTGAGQVPQGEQSGYGGIALPSGGGPGTKQAGITAATALFNAGFRSKADLEKITAISWRESKWDPTRKNPSTSDRGLMQINMSANKKLLQRLGYDEQDLYDVQKNANAAYAVYQEAGGYWPWGFSEHSSFLGGKPGWDRNGDPLGRTQGSNAAEVVRASGLPVGDTVPAVDWDSMRYQAMPMQPNNGKMIQFNNTFHVGNTGPGGQGIDMRRTVTTMANMLEDEMQRRMSRSN